MGKTLFKRSAAAGLAVALLAVLSLSANASLVFDLGTIISSSGTPGGVPPWLRATISQGTGSDASAVFIKMEALNLATTPSVEAVKDWAFNTRAGIAYTDLTVTETARTGEFLPNPLQVIGNANGYGGFAFDFDFGFESSNNSGESSRFTQGDSVTVKLTKAGGLLVSDFNYYASHEGRDFYSGAHIISLANNKSAFVGAPVPEPTTIVAGALLLLPFAASTVRFMRNRKS